MLLNEFSIIWYTVIFLTQTLRELEDFYKQMKSISWILWNFWHMLALSGCQSEQLDIQLMSLHSFELSITLFWVLVNTFLKVCGMLLLKFYLHYPGSCFCTLFSLRFRNISLCFHFLLHPDLLGFFEMRESWQWGVRNRIFFFICIYELKHSEKKSSFGCSVPRY